MTGFTWQESDSRWTEYEAVEPVPIGDVKYGVECPECGEELRNTEFIGDADDPAWHYECRECELLVTTQPTHVTAHVSDTSI